MTTHKSHDEQDMHIEIAAHGRPHKVLPFGHEPTTGYVLHANSDTTHDQLKDETEHLRDAPKEKGHWAVTHTTPDPAKGKPIVGYGEKEWEEKVSGEEEGKGENKEQGKIGEEGKE